MLRIIKEINEYIKKHQLERGNKLPSERDLSLLLKTSRSSVREAIRTLEERKQLEVKRGSGIYLLNSFTTFDLNSNYRSMNEDDQIRNLLEAKYVIDPIIVNLTILKAKDEDIMNLQNCIIQLSKSIVSRKLDDLVEADKNYHLTISLITKNHHLIEVMENLSMENKIFWKYFIENNEFINNVIFANYVGIVDSIKRKDFKKAAKLSRKNIINIHDCIIKIKNIDTLINFAEYQ